MTTDDFAKREYTRGYQRGRKATGWPENVPPIPTDSPLVAELMIAAREMRDAIDDVTAQFGEDDDVTIAMNPKIERVDEAMRAIGRWLMDQLDRPR